MVTPYNFPTQPSFSLPFCRIVRDDTATVVILFGERVHPSRSMTRSLIVVSLALAAAVAAAFATDNRRPERTTTRERRPERDKLLVIVIDG